MDAEKYADLFARCAVTGDRTAVIKLAAEHTKTALSTADIQSALTSPAARNALIGAGAGGLLGLTSSRNKLRRALQYGLLGAGGGLGVSALMGDLGSGKPQALAASISPKDRAAALAGKGNPTALAAAGGAAGGGLGYMAGGAIGDTVAKRQNELSRFIDSDHRLAKSVADLEQFSAGGPGTGKAVDKFKDDAFKAWASRRKSNPFTDAGMPNVSAAHATIDDVSKAMGADRLAYMPAARRGQLEALTRVIKARGGKSVNPAVLDRAIRSVPIPKGARIPRVGRGVGALLGLALGAMEGAQINRGNVLARQAELEKQFSGGQ